MTIVLIIINFIGVVCSVALFVRSVENDSGGYALLWFCLILLNGFLFGSNIGTLIEEKRDAVKEITIKTTESRPQIDTCVTTVNGVSDTIYIYHFLNEYRAENK